MLRLAIGLLILALAGLSGSAQESGETKLVSLAGREYAVERIGSITTFLCSPNDASEDCVLLKRLNLQPQVDWDELIEKARAGKPSKKSAKKKGKKKAPLPKEMTVDQFGGSWTVSLHAGSGADTPDFLKPYGCSILPNFSGYKVFLVEGNIGPVEILRTRAEWEEAQKELGIDPATGKKKSGFRGLFR